MSRTVDELGYQADVQGNMIEQHERRLRDLERRYSVDAQEQDHAWARKVDEKLDELESHRVFANDREYDRQARWHATRDAAIILAVAVLEENGERPVSRRIMEVAAEMANCAHGPLEVKP